ARAAVGVGHAKTEGHMLSLLVEKLSARWSSIPPRAFAIEKASRRNHLRRPFERARDLAGIGRRRLSTPRSRSVRAGGDPDREGRPLGAAAKAADADQSRRRDRGVAVRERRSRPRGASRRASWRRHA